MMESHAMRALRKYSSQAEPEVLDAMQAIADQEGRQLQAVIGDALREYLARKQQQQPRRNVIEAFQKSLKERDQLYRKLAK
jgi:predicted transcriptional regulator